MTRHDMVERIGKKYLTTNIESGEYSYIQAAGSRTELEKAVGHFVTRFKLDIRFEKGDTVILIETKRSFKASDEMQLAEYLEEERALHEDKNIICILANTSNDRIKVWRSFVQDEFVLTEEAVLETMEHYEKLFERARV